MKGWAWFIIILLLLLILGFGGWILFTRRKAARLGLPPPSLNPFASSSRSGGSGSTSNYPTPAPGGVRGWLDTQVRKFKNRRYATGAYEEPSSYSGARGVGGRGAGNRLDPDEAWDTRVGNEAYYEEQELGLHAPQGSTAYTGGSYGSHPAELSDARSTRELGAEPERGRSRTRDYEEESGARGLQNPFGDGNARSVQNPFGDDHASSLRGVSPRPLEHEMSGGAGGAPAQQQHGNKKGAGAGVDDSPTERRSMFRENM